MAGNEGEALLRVAEELCAGLGDRGRDDCQEEDRTAVVFGGSLTPADEELVASLRGSLAFIARAVGPERKEGVQGRAVRAALDGTELVLRGELAMGNAKRLPELMPSIVFLVALSVTSQDKALELSDRTTRLLEQALSN